MTRQINLYSAALRKKTDFLSSSNLVLAALLCLLVVTAGAGMARWSLAKRMQEARGVSAELASAREVFAELTRVASSRKPDPELIAEVASLQRKVASAQRAEMLLRAATADGGRVQLGEMMRGFSRAAVDGLWLTGFMVTSEGADLAIRGRMSDQALLPKYLGRLEGEPVFRDRQFSALEMRGGEWVVPSTEGMSTRSAGEKSRPWFVEFSLRTVNAPAQAKLGDKQ